MPSVPPACVARALATRQTYPNSSDDDRDAAVTPTRPKPAPVLRVRKTSATDEIRHDEQTRSRQNSG